MNLFRLSGRKVCEHVKVKGFLWRGKHFHARFLRGLPRSMPKDSAAGLYAGLLTSTKLHKSAVKRNRMRRRCREALRLTLKNSAVKVKDGLTAQLLLLPRSSSLSAPFGELLGDADQLVRFLSSHHA